MDKALQLLKELIAVDSINPSLVPGAAGEAAVARTIAEAMRGMGLTVETQDVAPGRPNVVGTLDGRVPGRSLMFCGHIDTVGVTGMKAPFDPAERDGRIYGRGSQDMKSGVAAMIDAARVIAESGGLAAGKLVIACVVDEEHASIGADALVTRWRADAAVVTEPTDLQIAIAHKGFEWVEIETEGRAAHGSRPREGRDAIRLMARVLTGLDTLDKRSAVAIAASAARHRVAARVADRRRPRVEQLSRSLSSADGAAHDSRRGAGHSGEGSGRPAGAPARGGSRLQGGEQGDVRAIAVRDRRESRAAASDAARTSAPQHPQHPSTPAP